MLVPELRPNPIIYIYSIRGTFFKSSRCSIYIEMLANFICEYDNTTRIIKSRFMTNCDTSVYKEILNRLKNKEDIPYLTELNLNIDTSRYIDHTINNAFRERYDRRKL